MPYECPTGCEYARKLIDHALIVRRVGEKAERREEIEHSVEAACPIGRKLAHIAAVVPERGSRTALPGSGEERRREIQAIDEKARFREQMTVSPLSARYVEDTRARGQPEHVNDTRDLAPIALERE